MSGNLARPLLADTNRGDHEHANGHDNRGQEQSKCGSWCIFLSCIGFVAIVLGSVTAADRKFREEITPSYDDDAPPLIETMTILTTMMALSQVPLFHPQQEHVHAPLLLPQHQHLELADKRPPC